MIRRLIDALKSLVFKALNTSVENTKQHCLARLAESCIKLITDQMFFFFTHALNPHLTKINPFFVFLMVFTKMVKEEDTTDLIDGLNARNI